MNLQLIECRCALRQALRLGYTCGRLETATVDLVLDSYGLSLVRKALRNYAQLLNQQCGTEAVSACTDYLNRIKPA